MPWLALLLAADSLRAFSLAVAPAESVAVTTAGAGAPVVLVPGMFGSAFGYRKVIPLLTQAGYRVVVVEPLAIGNSSRPEHADYSLTAQAARIAAALDRLAVRDAIVVAHSTGASMTYRLAYRRPDLVAGIVSIEGGPTERATTPAFRRALQLAPWIKLFGGVKLVRRKIHGQLLKASGDTSWVSDTVVEAYTAGAARDLDGTLKAFLAMAQRREPEQLRPHLAEVRCPVRLLLGTAAHEGGVPTEEVALMARSLAEFAVDSVAGAGHYIHEEQPAAVAAAVQRVRLSLPLTGRNHDLPVHVTRVKRTVVAVGPHRSERVARTVARLHDPYELASASIQQPHGMGEVIRTLPSDPRAGGDRNGGRLEQVRRREQHVVRAYGRAPAGCAGLAGRERGQDGPLHPAQPSPERAQCIPPAAGAVARFPMPTKKQIMATRSSTSLMVCANRNVVQSK